MSVENPEVEQTWRLEEMLKTYEPFPCFRLDVARIKLELHRRGELVLTANDQTALQAAVDEDDFNRATAFIEGSHY